MPPLRTGFLVGLRVIELASLAPAPFACTVMSDLGAEVLRIDRPDTVPARLKANADSDADATAAFAAASAAGGASSVDEARPPVAPPADPLGRGRQSVAIDLRHPRGAETLLRLVEHADVLVEGFRPGVCERLGIGPEECAKRNPGLIYARMTGYGQDGPLSARAGHDINYLSLSGALEPLGPPDGPPLPP